MANTLTVKLTVTDANGVIAGATPTAGINFSMDYTKATKNEGVLAAAGTATIALTGDQKAVLILATAGDAVVDISDDTGTTKVPTVIDATEGGFFFVAEPNNGQDMNWAQITAGGSGCTYQMYSWN
jgi:hypothetical protein